MKIGISINLTAHREGMLLYRTVRSIREQINYLKKNLPTVAYEFNVSVDNPDEETLYVIDMLKSKFTDTDMNIFNVEFGDLSESRNYLISKSKGKYIAILDGDDFFSSNYLYECYITAEKNNVPAVYHADNFITFEGGNLLWKRGGYMMNHYSNAMLLLENPFVSQVFVHSDIYKEIKYDSISKDSGYGCEDWHWNTKVINRGFKYFTVKETTASYRIKLRGSLLMSQVESSSTLRPSEFFEPENFVRLSGDTIGRIKPALNKKSNHEPNKNGNAIRNIYDKRMPVPLRKYLASTITATKDLIGEVLSTKKTSEKPSNDPYGDMDISVKSIFIDRFGSIFGSRSDIDIFWEQWHDMNRFEPLINQRLDTIRNMTEYKVFNEGDFSVAYEYYKFCKYTIEKGIKFKHIVFVPWLTTGGSDMVAIKLANYLAKDGSVLLIATDKHGNTHHDKFNENVYYYDFTGVYGNNQSIDYIDKFTLRLIQNIGARTVTSVNSFYANKLIAKYGKQIKDSVKIFMNKWSLPKHFYDCGYYEWPNDIYRSTYDFVEAIITDNKAVVEKIKDIMNPLDYKIKVLDLVCPSHPKIKSSFTPKNNRILIAGRISKWDKSIDEAIEVAKLCPDKEFHFYGKLDDYYSYNNRFANIISNISNIKYKGMYKGFSSIDVSRYDALLVVSYREEGLPNVVLEAIGSNLFVISNSEAGGIPDVVEHGVNGYIAKDPVDIKEYAGLIKDYYNKFNKELFEKQLKLNESIMRSRTEESLNKQFGEIFLDIK